MIQEIEFILYVSDQAKSKEFYEKLLQLKPSLDVPGMTEFQLVNGIKLGLMPEKGIAKIITPFLPHPEKANGVPRCELYLKVENVKEYFKRGIELGAIEISPLKNRDWGDKVGYLADRDGHVIGIAEKGN